MNVLMLNEFEGHHVRSNVDEFGVIWFVAQDVCDILGIKYQRHALRKLDASERGGFQIPGSGGNREFAAVSEIGLYSLILMSRKPDALRLKRWVTSEVLPSIRRTGSYSVPGISSPAPLTGTALVRSMCDQLDTQNLKIDMVNMKVVKIEVIQKQVQSQLDSVGIEAKQDQDTLTHDQIVELDHLMKTRFKDLKLKDQRHHGFMKKSLKEKLLPPGTKTVMTFKDLRRSDFEKAKQIIDSYSP